MDDFTLLDRVAQAQLVGVKPATVSGWHRQYHAGHEHPYPSHVPGEHVVTSDGRILVRSDALLRWHRATRDLRRPGAPRRATGALLDSWARMRLAQIAEDPTNVPSSALKQLITAGYVTVTVTDAGRAALDAHTPRTPPTGWAPTGSCPSPTRHRRTKRTSGTSPAGTPPAPAPRPTRNGRSSTYTGPSSTTTRPSAARAAAGSPTPAPPSGPYSPSTPTTRTTDPSGPRNPPTQ